MSQSFLERIASFNGVQAVIFDVDGTLYNLRKMRFFIAVDLCMFFIFQPWRWSDILVLYCFRKNRELLSRNSSRNISTTQYEFCIRGKKTDSKYVERLVKEWIYDRPLRYIRSCAYMDVIRCIRTLSDRGVKIAYFSDYPLQEKIRTLELPCDYLIASSDTDVDALKPNPCGLLKLVSQMNISIEHCIFVGDTQKKDGVAAGKIGMKFLLLRNGSAD